MGNLSIHCFSWEGGDRNLRIIKKACEMRLEELQNEAIAHNKLMDEAPVKSKTRHMVNFSFEVIEGMDNVRVNLYGGTTKDAITIGYNICMLQTNPVWL